MNANDLRALQAPLKERYKTEPAAAVRTLTARGELGPGITCKVETHIGPVIAGLHPAAGGPGGEGCSGDMLLESLAACAGVTLMAVATAMNIPIQGGTVTAEGDLDFRGTLGVSKEAPVGFQSIRLRFELQGPITAEQKATLFKLTERYCVIYQTLARPPRLTATG